MDAETAEVTKTAEIPETAEVPEPTRRSPAKRAAMLRAAEDLFLQRGYVGTSMDDLATAAGVSKQTLYTHFGNKEALFVELVSRLTSDAGDRVERGDLAPSTLRDVRDAIVAFGTQQLGIVLTARLLRLRRLVIGEVERFPELAATLYERGPARGIAWLAELVDRGVRAGVLDLGGLTTAAAGERLNWLIMGAPLHRAMLLGDGAALDGPAQRAHVQEAVEIFLRSIGTAH